MGLKYALGDYINYMDSDDLITSDTFEEVLNFFSKYPNDDYDFVAIPVEFFDMKEGGHYLNFRFDEVKGEEDDVFNYENVQTEAWVLPKLYNDENPMPDNVKEFVNMFDDMLDSVYFVYVKPTTS